MTNTVKKINMLDAVKLFLKIILTLLAELAEVNTGGHIWHM